MTFAQLLKQTPLDDILVAMKQLHPDTSDNNLEGYSHVYGKLLKLEPTGEPATILIERVVENCDGEPDDYLHVSKVDSDGEVWAADYWDWSNMLISEVEDLANLSPAEQVAITMWEMTWHGFTQEQVSDAAAEMFSRMSEVEANAGH